MNKSQLVEKLAKDEGLTIQAAESVVNQFFGEIETALMLDERVEIRGFGSFKAKHYEGYTGRNPKTGDPIRVRQKRLPFFKPGKDLKERADVM